VKPAAAAAIVFLLLLGIFAATGRVFFINDFAQRGLAARQRLVRMTGGDDRVPPQRAADVTAFDARYAAHRLATWLHVIPGGAFLALAPLQFSSKLRRRWPGVHRWLGRALIACALISAAAAFFFAMTMPFAGVAESIPIGLFGAFFVFAIARGFILIRRRDVVRHREWMTRAFAFAIAISTVRVFDGIFDATLSPLGYSMRSIFVIAVWAGWLTTGAVAEMWIRLRTEG
jgi:uncharacterized membrane protein